MKRFTQAIILTVTCLFLQHCKKDGPSANVGGNSSNNGNTDTTTTITPPTEPAIAATQGFFLDNWQAKTFTVPANQTASKPDATNAVAVTVDLANEITKVSGYEYGNNSNPYMGNISTDAVLMPEIKALSPNIIRFPGGSLSDVYFWNQSSQPPADAPSQLLDENGNASAAYYWYGNSPSAGTMTVDDYYTVLQQTKATGMITVNYGYARYGTGPNPVQTAAHLAANWVRYDNGRTTYWEVGNECYGTWEAGYYINTSANQDGQVKIQDGITYGNHFKIFADSMRAAAAQVGNTNIKIGIVLDVSNDANGAGDAQIDNWNNSVLTTEGNSADFFVVHNYYTPYGQNSDPATILNTPVTGTSNMMSWLKQSSTSAAAVLKPVAMDEWNIQAEGSAQMVSNVAGVHAVMVLGEALKNQISMTSRWDLANAWNNGDDMGMFSNSAPGGAAEPNVPAWNPRPAFYYMYFFQHMVGDHIVSATSNNSDIVSYGSSYTSGEAGVILVNKGSADHVVSLNFRNFAAGSIYYYYTLNGGTDNAPFSHKVYVNGVGPSGSSGGPSGYATIAASSAGVTGGIVVNVPQYGAVYLVVAHK
jgi:hypothetical protein